GQAEPELPDPAGFCDLAALRAELKKVLPDHMIPSRFAGLASLPLTASGKIDHKALPDVAGSVARSAFAAPVTASEQQVADAFCALLDVEQAGRHDGFFELGGHSLSAVRLVARLEQHTGQALGVRDVFEEPTVAGLAARLEAAGGQRDSLPLVAVDRAKPVPLSFAQERLWFLDRLDARAGRAYHMETAFRIDGAVDVRALDRALVRLVTRHEVLRTVFAADGAGVPHQVVRDVPDSGLLTVEDASGLDMPDLMARLATLLARPFDLETGPLFRAHLLARGTPADVLVLGGHHAVLDGWSLGILFRELAELYREATGGPAAGLMALPVRYADYAHWQRQVLSADRLAAETGWWQETLSGVPEAITLPFDRPRPQVMDYAGGVVPLTVGRAVTGQLKGLARQTGATLFMVLEAAFSALLSRLGAGRDVVVGTP
ncbi:condensation domain-containing protein, partial [Roseibium sp. RKSG952]|uniref:condensation domain-containing protein n=1 Tax=Roseibium sp. RKSG952 TaxID=2529384 RepID=UPI0013C6C191